jgi:hypothetical protein
MGGRQLSFLPESADEDGDQLDLIEEVAKVEHCAACGEPIEKRWNPDRGSSWGHVDPTKDGHP